MPRTSSSFILGLLLSVCLAGTARGATFTPRFGHTATLLASGDILLVGGAQGPSPLGALTTVQLWLEGRGTLLDMTPLTVARASHTATLLPNGRVLVTGGRDATGASRSDGVVFDPLLNSWTAAGGAMSATRFNHTATLLKTGSVLLCGGQNSGGTMNSSCDLYDPATNLFSAAGSLQAARAAHTATLLPDGRVYVAGGYDVSASPSRYLVTTEVYNPGTNGFLSASPLISARAFHTATMLGSGKVLIAGGFNGRNLKANIGILDSTEIYDPISDSVVPAQPMQVRRQGHTAILDPGGEVSLYGGLGNQTTSYLTAISALLAGGSNVTGTPGVVPVSNVTGGSLIFPMDFSLGVRSSGVIQEGYVFFSSPSVNFGAGVAYFTPGNAETVSGLRVDLAGTSVVCDITDGTCGHIRKTVTPVGMAGTYTLYPQSVGLTSMGSFTGSVQLSGTLSESAPQQNLVAGGSSITGQTRITGLPAVLIGADITAGTFVLSGGSLSNTSSFTVTLDGGSFSVPAGTTIEDDGAGGARTEEVTVTISNLTGRANWAGSTGQQFTSPLQWTSQYPPPSQSGLLGTLTFTASPINLANQTFVAEGATVVIRGMFYGDEEAYKPQTNAWVYHYQGSTPKFSHTATLTPDGDIAVFGGKSCANATCSSLAALGVGPIRIPALPAWTALSGGLSARRANHTATLLPDGRILAAGGSNGPNVERTADLFDPVTRTFAQTGSMRDVRALHTASLLPNGRVLVAGGFSTSATSTGSINGAEVYFPDTGVWRPTSVMASSRSNHTALNLADGNVMVVGGYAGGSYLASAEVYYSTAGVWRALPSMSGGRARHTATLLQDRRVLVVGGVNSAGVLGTAALYNPATGAWSAASPLAAGAISHSHSATLLPDGRVLVAGGNDGFGEINLSQIYDPASDSWSQTDNTLGAGRFNHTATVLPNGIVLVAGGAQGGNNMISTVETFDVGASSWSGVGSLSGPRGYHTTTLARDGVLYALGGQSGPSTFLTSADAVYFSQTPDAASAGFPPSLRKSTITAVDRTLFDRGEGLTLTGMNFHGTTEASGGGAGSANSSHYGPRVVLQAVDGSGGSSSQGNGGYVLDLTTRIYASNPTWSLIATSITVAVPASAAPLGPSLPYGWYHLREGSNAQYSDSLLVQAGPAKPTSPASAVLASVLGTSSVDWSWTTAPGSYDGYNLYASSNGVWVTTRPASATSFTQTGLGPNTTLQLTLAPYTLSGDGPLAASATYFTLAAPVTGLAVSSVTGTDVTLSWNANANSQGTIFEVTRSTDAFASSFSTPIPAALGLTTTTVLIAPLEVGVSYSFRVRAFNGAGLPSAFSATVTTTTRSTITGLQGVAQSTTKIRWSWAAPSGFSGTFKLYNAVTGAVIATPGSNQYDDDLLGTNTARAVMVSAVNAAGEGPLTGGVTVYTLAADPTPGVPPIVGITTGSLTGSWQANGNPLGTLYDLSVVTVVSGSSVTTSGIAGFSAGVGDLLPAEVYEVKLLAHNGDGLPTSLVVLGSTPTLPLAPINLRVTGTTPASVAVSWETGANVSSATYAVSYTSAPLPAPSTAFISVIPFSQNFKGTTALITGLMTASTYTIQVQASNTAGATSAPVSVTTLTFNGGVPFGSVGGTAAADQNNVLSGSLGNGRSVSLRAASQSFPSDVFLMISSFNAAGANSKCPGGLDIGIEIQPTPALQPTRPLFLTVSYAAGELGAVSASQATFFRFDPIGGRCVPLQTAVDTVNRTITAQLNHLSQFQVAAMTAATTPEDARVYPNPFYASRDGYVTLDQVPAGARVRVFTLRGEMLLDQPAGATGLLTWGGTNRGGRPAASGVYLISIESGGMKKILKLAVVR